MNAKLEPVKWDHEILYAERAEDEQLLIRPLLWKTKKYERGGRLKIRIIFFFYGDSLWTVARIVRQIKFVTVKVSLTHVQVLFKSLFCLTLLNVTVAQNFRLCLYKRWTTVCVWNSVILCNVNLLKKVREVEWLVFENSLFVLVLE
jgi:hypothetical protein